VYIIIIIIIITYVTLTANTATSLMIRLNVTYMLQNPLFNK